MRFLLVLLTCLAISLTVSWAGTGRKASEAIVAKDPDKGLALQLTWQIKTPLAGKMPAEILQLSPSDKYALLADASQARIYVLENRNGEPHLIRDFYLTIGKNGVGKNVEGDKRTPLGVYKLAAALPARQLTSFYGAGAFPLNYPNAWDKSQGKTGHGIWLHGVPPNVDIRPPKDSDGCLVVSNPDWNAIANYIQPGNTPVIITRKTEWLEPTAWKAKRQALFDAVSTWRHAWSKHDDDAYFSHYSEEYLSRLGQSWRQSRERDIAQQERLSIDLADMSLFEYGQDPTVVLDFEQNQGSGVAPRQMYMKQEDGRWRIVLEQDVLPLPTITASN